MTEVAFSWVEKEKKAAPGGPKGRSTGPGCGGPVGLAAAAGLRRLWRSGHPLRGGGGTRFSREWGRADSRRQGAGQKVRPR